MKKLTDYEIKPMFPGLSVSDPQISPDGDRILFTYTESNLKKNKYDSHIWLLPIEKGRPMQFTRSKGNDTNPRWSPDGRSILFLSDREGEEKGEDEKKEKKKTKSQLWVIPADGGEANCLTSIQSGVQNPVWSPDGKKILFATEVFKGEGEPDGDVKIITRIKYRFDGRGYLHGKWIHLFSVPSKGGKTKQITDGEFDVEAAKWSPDGKKIAFISNMDEYPDISHFENIYVVTSEGGKPEILWEGEKAGVGHIGNLAWSPDGKYIVFTGRVIEDISNIGYKNTDLWLFPVEGGEIRNLTADLDRTVSVWGAHAMWSHDSKYIYFNIPDRGAIHLCRVSLNGKVENIVEGRMQVGGFSLDKAGSTIAFTSSDFTSLFEVWIYRAGETKRVTEMNKDLLKTLDPMEPDEYWFTSSAGNKLQGWILKPRDFREGVNYPMILSIHGGPASAYGYSLTSPDFTLLANHGYSVAFMNPTGSIGFGEEFTASVSGHWGERDYEDIMEAVDYVLETYDFIDHERLGVMGVSYGGYMTNWIVGHTDRFKAAVALNSMANLYSGTGTSDIDYMDHSVTAGKNPWEDVQFFMDKSPISYVEKVVTPLLLIHSEQDYRCPIDNAEQMFTALKKLRKQVEFVRFQGSHGFGRIGKPKDRIQRLQHVLRWFDRYLK